LALLLTPQNPSRFEGDHRTDYADFARAMLRCREDNTFS
jgi:hypothetical protein